MVVKENSQYKTIWICYQAHLKENSRKWKNDKNPLPVDQIHFKLLPFSKQTKDLVALLSNCAIHRNSTLKQHEK